jgi:hypothetical protein
MNDYNVTAAFLSELWLKQNELYRYINLSKDYHIIASLPKEGKNHKGRGTAIIIKKSWVASIKTIERRKPGCTTTVFLQDIHGTNWLLDSYYVKGLKKPKQDKIKYLLDFFAPIENLYQNLSYLNPRL